MTDKEIRQAVSDEVGKMGCSLFLANAIMWLMIMMSLQGIWDLIQTLFCE